MVDFSKASESEKKFLASNTRSKDALRKLATEKSEEVLLEVLGNINTPTDVIEELTLSQSTKVSETAQKQLRLREKI